MRMMSMKNNVANPFGEEGYTLVETIVAMALFVSVLLPLITTMTNFMFGDTSLLEAKASLLAQSELSQVSRERSFSDTTFSTKEGLIVERHSEMHGQLVSVIVSVGAVKHPQKDFQPGKKILMLCKLFPVKQ